MPSTSRICRARRTARGHSPTKRRHELLHAVAVRRLASARGPYHHLPEHGCPGVLTAAACWRAFSTRGGANTSPRAVHVGWGLLRRMNALHQHASIHHICHCIISSKLGPGPSFTNTQQPPIVKRENGTNTENKDVVRAVRSRWGRSNRVTIPGTPAHSALQSGCWLRSGPCYHLFHVFGLSLDSMSSSAAAGSETAPSGGAGGAGAGTGTGSVDGATHTRVHLGGVGGAPAPSADGGKPLDKGGSGGKKPTLNGLVEALWSRDAEEQAAACRQLTVLGAHSACWPLCTCPNHLSITV